MIKKFITLLFGPMRVGTHNGSFHCDQVLACAMLTNYVNKFKGAEIVRSRDPKVWETCDIIVDVGGKYQPIKMLDHHQIQFKMTYPNYNVTLSSAGLVYYHFPQIITNIIDEILQKEGQKLSFKPLRSQQIQADIRQKIYKSFILYVDANDNGFDKINDKQYSHVPTTLWCRVSKLNPMWWDEKADQMKQFLKAVEIAKEQIYSEVCRAFLGSIQTKGMVLQAFKKRQQIHKSGKIVLLQKYVPWQKVLKQIQIDSKHQGEVLYVVFPDKTGNGWRIQAVPQQQGSFSSRKPLKEEWRGIKDIQKLINISGIKDIDFVHASGFIGGAKSRQSTILMGQLSFI